MPTNDTAARQMREMPMQHLQAEIRSLSRADGETDAAPDNEFEVVMSTGATVRRFDWWSGKRYDEELVMAAKSVRTDRLDAGAAVLNSHRSWDLGDVIGAVVPGSVRLEKGKLVGRVRLDDGPENQAVLRKVRAGMIRFVSVGYVVHRYTKVEREGQPELWRADDWEPHELSFVPIPADAGASVRSESQRTFPCEFINHHHQRKDPTMPQNDTTPTPEATPSEVQPKARAATPEPTEEPTSPPDEAAIRKAERERISQIRARCATAGLDDTFADGLVEAGRSVADASDAILRQLADKQQAEQPGIRGQNNIRVGEDEHQKFLRGTSDWLLVRAGSAVSGLVRTHTKTDLQPGEFRGMSLLDVARECLERRGVSTRGMSKMELVGQAYTHRSAITQTSSDFSVLLENTLHKVLLASYATAPDTWRRFCKTGSVSDFRAHNRYRQGTFGTLDQVNEAGEFKNKPIPDGSKETITAVTKGNIINLSRQSIINDDMGAFNDLAMRFGRSAKLSIEKDVYALLAENGNLGPTMSDGKSLFHTDHNNIGSSSALTVLGVDADAALMAEQKDPSDNEILALEPAILLVHRSLKSTANTLNDAQYDPDTANKLQKPNAVRGLFSDIVATAQLPAASTRRYLFADPAVAPTIEVAFLDGVEEPFMDVQEGWRVDGTEWKVRLDYATAGVDWRGAVTNAGV